MVYIPEELIIDILSRVPARTVGRCRCVSKQWKSLLSQPEFLKTHLNKTQNSNLVQESLILANIDLRSLHSAQVNVFDEIITINATKLDFINPLFNTRIYVAPPCNGLILVVEEDKNKFYSYLINPLTKETKQLPKLTYPDGKHGFLSQYVSLYGVGYDSVSDDYKVVVIFSFPFGYYEDAFDESYDRMYLENIANVYSLRKDRWTVVENPSVYCGSCLSPGVCLGGFIHWSAIKVESDSEYYSESDVILTFDLRSEKFGEIQSPGSKDYHGYYQAEVQKLGKYLCVYYVLEDQILELWRMEEYGVVESWTKYLIFDPDRFSLVPVCLMPKQQLVMGKDLFRYYGRDHKLVVYDSKDGAFKDIQVHGTPAIGYSANWTFIESLVSFNELASL